MSGSFSLDKNFADKAKNFSSFLFLSLSAFNSVPAAFFPSSRYTQPPENLYRTFPKTLERQVLIYYGRSSSSAGPRFPNENFVENNTRCRANEKQQSSDNDSTGHNSSPCNCGRAPEPNGRRGGSRGARCPFSTPNPDFRVDVSAPFTTGSPNRIDVSSNSLATAAAVALAGGFRALFEYPAGNAEGAFDWRRPRPLRILSRSTRFSKY